MTPPMGLMYLSAVLKSLGHTVRVIDTRFKFQSATDLAKQASEFGPHIIGLSAILLEYLSFHQYAEALKKAVPHAHIVAGGPYPSTDPVAVLAHECVDCAVMGEAETTFPELIDAMANGRPWDALPGLAVRRNGGVEHTRAREFIADLDSLPYPDWDALDLPAYAHTDRFSNLPPGPYMTIFTSRSCPYHCIYCHNIFGKTFRARSPENILGEIRILHDRYGIRDLEILDDCFNLDHARAMEICGRIIASGMKLRLSFPNGVRADRLDKELITKLGAAGARHICVAIESASPRIQKMIRKNLDLDKATRAICDITRAGIFCHGFFMLGFPTETPDEIRQTIRFATASRLHAASFFVAKSMPGTEMHRMAGEMGLLNAVNNSGDFGYTTFDYTSTGMTGAQLHTLYRTAYARFFLSPRRMFMIAKDFPDKKYIVKKAMQLALRISGIRNKSKERRNSR